MKRRNISRVRPTGQAQTITPEKIRVLLISLICVAVVAAGFFFAARQHFATMEFGLKNSQLRKQVDNLEAERRRLILAKEVSLSPASIKETASKLGFRESIAVPPTSVGNRIEPSISNDAPKAELTSLRSGNAAQPAIVKMSMDKKLVKPIVQQATVKSPNERPRIAASEAVAAAVPKSIKNR